MSYEQHNQLAEQNVIGALLNNNDLLSLVSDTLRPEDFYFNNNRTLYTAILELNEKNEPFDMFTAADQANEFMHGTDEKLDAYAGQLAHDTPKNANIVSYAASVLRKSKERDMIDALQNSINDIRSGNRSTEEKLQSAIASVNAIDPDTLTKTMYSRSIKEIGQEWLNEYENKIENPDDCGLTTGIDGIDEIVGARGIQPGDVVVIAARPKMFKTATMTKIINHTAVDLKKPVLCFSMEMRSNLMFERALTQDCGVTNDNFYKVMSNDNYAKVHNSMARLLPTEIYIDDRSNLTLNQIKSEARKRSKELGGYGSIGAITLDYFTLMNLEDNKQNPAHGYAQLSKGIVALGKELGCPIYLLAQLNRECEKRTDKRPMPSDLGDTGQLERDASLIIMLYNDVVYNPDSNMKGILELIIRVNRNGGTGTAYQCTANGRLTDIAPADIARAQADHEFHERQKPAEEMWEE